MTTKELLDRGLNLPSLWLERDAYTFSQNAGGSLDVAMDGDSEGRGEAMSGYRHYGLVPSFTDPARAILFVKVPAGSDVRVSHEAADALRIELIIDGEVIGTTGADAQPVVVAHGDLDGDALRTWYDGAFGHRS